MNYEEKYKNALERAKELCDVADTFTITIHDICTIFPELHEQESEDERIRKAIIAYISHDQHCGVSNADMIAWLEKQGEKTHAELSQQKVTKTSDQELSDKMEPKKLDADKLYDEVTKPHWISVEDELPPMRDENGTSDIVLTHTKGGGIYFNRYDYKGNTWGNPLAFNITYWMPLPQAPTVAENATVKKKGGKQ